MAADMSSGLLLSGQQAAGPAVVAVVTLLQVPPLSVVTHGIGTMVRGGSQGAT